MQTLYILSLGAAAVGGAGFLGTLYYLATGPSRADRQGPRRDAESDERSPKERVAVYEFVEFDSDSSL